ncbi:HlyD family efflux transporter periplasmic adaptor subunit [Nannocystis sp. SCPEA4]|uniref:HlyD family secretion protein n=1 Tax=Nannocystis sp. SCPEA4 TaxID=2996787 RepID=UPI00226D7554|nr:HlyD family efflux transporter periplasmic adaptor subunit [Nannocystis sp. SCPEA4]
MDVPRAHRRLLGRHGGKVLAAAVVVAILAATTVAIGQLRAPPPTVVRAGLWLGTVERGEMLREVQGNGKLVPEHMQWVTALSAARVEQIFVRPGAPVEVDTVLLELRNPELELQALEAERDVAAAKTVLANMRATLRSEKLAQELTVATLQVDKRTARRKSDANLALDERGYVSGDDAHSAKAQLETIERRIGLEEQRLAVLGDGLKERLAAQTADVARLQTIADFRRRQLDGLRVHAGVAGVLQELPLEAGQWVSAGALLAKIARPDRLKAQLAIPETLAKDMQPGLRAHVDTRNGMIDGEVVRVDPAASKGTVTVDVALTGPLPRGARPDLTIVGTVELERLADVLHVRRPAFVQPDSTMGIFRLDAAGPYATRVNVQFARTSATTVEIVAGLTEGDRIILSDMTEYDAANQVQLE